VLKEQGTERIFETKREKQQDKMGRVCSMHGTDHRE
jgi:hypothetical protein